MKSLYPLVEDIQEDSLKKYLKFLIVSKCLEKFGNEYKG